MTLEQLVDLFSHAEMFGGVDALADNFWAIFSQEGGDNNLV